MKVIAFANGVIRNPDIEPTSSRPISRLYNYNTHAIRVLLIALLASLSCRADEQTTLKSGRAPAPRRTWLEVEFETSTAFDACRESVRTVMGKQPPGVSSIGGRCGGSISPDISFTEIVFDRHPSGRPKEVTIILDVRIERNYNGETGKASAFRILRHIAKDEGKEMLAEMISFFEKRKWPYEILDCKTSPTVKPKQENNKTKSSPVF